MSNIIHYGIGRKYLPEWGVKEALREIYQNFMDYGKYEIEVTDSADDIVIVTLSNDYAPTDLTFLRIGDSYKDNAECIGKHGEGLKMAMLVLLRNNYTCSIITQKGSYVPIFMENGGLQDCLAVKVEDLLGTTTKFSVIYSCSKTDHDEFSNSILDKESILFTNPNHGDILNKVPGFIYSGGLFVTKVDNLKRAYNILPSNLHLDRDRRIPSTFDVNYHASKLNSQYGKFTAKDTSYSDMDYVDTVPDELVGEVTPRKMGNSIAFTYKDNGTDKLIENTSVIGILERRSIFSKVIDKIKQSVIKYLGLYTILDEFKKVHLKDVEAIEAFDIIMNQVKTGNI